MLVHEEADKVDHHRLLVGQHAFIHRFARLPHIAAKVIHQLEADLGQRLVFLIRHAVLLGRQIIQLAKDGHVLIHRHALGFTALDPIPFDRWQFEFAAQRSHAPAHRGCRCGRDCFFDHAYPLLKIQLKKRRTA